MFELLVAFVLYQFNASAAWWGAFIALLVGDFLFAFYRGYSG
jgi:hypothetical protein